LKYVPFSFVVQIFAHNFVTVTQDMWQQHSGRVKDII